MDKEKHYLTLEGLEKLKKELDYLENQKRKEISNRLEEAIAMGDLSENAAYDEAKQAKEELERRILEIKEILKNYEIINTDNTQKDLVNIGATIIVEGPNNKDKEFTIVGRNEVDPFAGKISNESPLGQAFLGKKIGDKVKVITPKGEIEYKIKKISY